MTMELQELKAEEYAAFFHDSSFFYATSHFNELNASKCDQVYYLCARSGKFRLGIIGGRVGDVFTSPFSAPFGGFVFSGDHLHLAYVDEAISLFIDWVRRQGMEQIRIVLPPSIYGEDVVTKVTNSLIRNGFNLNSVDLNYYFSLDLFGESYDKVMRHNARKNLKKALEHQLDFAQCTTEADKALAYDIIRKNRAARGYPLKMSMSNVMRTSGLVDSDFFLVRDLVGEPVAAAIVFHVTEKIVQVIYWGGLPEYNHLRSVNFLAFRLFDFYKRAGKAIVDVGPSTENSIPNYGLCDFKESLGCLVVPKMSFVRQLVLVILSFASEAAMFIENLFVDKLLIFPV